eukprot:CAMPEP_0115559646 /NCGR_PEP_ID=MMETSP0271-20121206/100060_1 /TAXON_ID=71861 /ORGANISM="Scrippsiella trochoidea, Strain CCMP3099" /LENGTH=39 /DNA_ID= /DNA_START= /DNA_END= /DNA_ORIENTATION=
MIGKDPRVGDHQLRAPPRADVEPDAYSGSNLGPILDGSI